jgi:hypothetical protein
MDQIARENSGRRGFARADLCFSEDTSNGKVMSSEIVRHAAFELEAAMLTSASAISESL